MQLPFEIGTNATTYGLNAVVLFGLVALVGRLGKTSGVPYIRIAILSALLLVDACAMLWVDCSARSVAYIAIVFSLAATTFPSGLTAGLTASLGSKRFALYLVSVFSTAALFYVYLPITTFLTSPGELSIHLEYLINENAKAGMVILYAASALYAMVFSARLKSLLTLLAMSTLLLSLVYAYVLPFGYPMMNGLMFEQIPIEASVLAQRAVVDALVIPASALLCLFTLVKFGAPRVLLVIVLLNVSLGLAAAVTVTQDRADTGTKLSQGATEGGPPVRFSKTHNNVLVVFLDRFMGGFVERILADDPSISTALEGFTWYPRTLAPGENSLAGIHAMLGGYDYTPREFNKRNKPLRDTSVEAFSILPYNFSKKGYVANVVSPRGLGFTVEGDCSFLTMPGVHCSHIPAAVTRNLAEKNGVSMKVLADSMYADLLVLLSLMRGTPYLMRAVVHERGPWRPFLDHSAGTTFKQWAELKSLPALSTADANESNFNVFFNMLPHEPYFMGEDCVPKSTRLKNHRAAKKRGYNNFGYQHYVAARCALRIVADYMQWLRNAGVYDNTKIVIVSDHGIAGRVEDHSSRAKAGGTTSADYVRSRSVLIVKDRNAHGPMQVSEEYLPNAETPRIVCEEIGGCVNPYLNNKTIEAHGRRDPFHVDFVPWQFNEQKPNEFRIRGTMTLTGGDPYDASGWKGRPPRR